MFKGTKIQNHIDAFNDLLLDLLKLDEYLSDEKNALQLLSCLLASYHTLSCVLLYQTNTALTTN